MAGLREVSRSAHSLSLSQILRLGQSCWACQRRSSSTETKPDQAALGVVTHSSFDIPQLTPEQKATFRPWKRAADRKFNLPSSRYQYHPPKYNRGPLHPIQSPMSSDPIARDFVPGPFNLPRLKQTYQSTVAPDLMTLAYNHVPPGTKNKEPPADRLRGWDGSSPYHENRQKRGPRGAPVLPIRERNITFRNIPEIKEITVSAYVPEALKNDDHLVVARTVVLNLTGAMPEITRTRKSVVQWGIVSGRPAGVKATIYGNAAYEFLDRCTQLVFPRIKDWKGIKATTGDSSGNLSWGLNPEDVALFPEVEASYSVFPAKMIPGVKIFVKTTATSDRQARLLLQAMGIPFYGEIRN
ncbi:mitochondrial ribosomal protein l7-like protein [Lasiosphaeria miniovina]|uniref:Mitochondrial ribosomal protein l7-like protein n=1 Tax=Lasiosphaeria miniovina TaxID=1954250 RepID=A0AA40E4Y3_9PEZI|nr:mitochondrial ribosomal protein l7-like protein [Lasiosphaeria miniovina]KAK0727250.1 mitochondrial ribosomal protein l7-like protein [Lasiosphaeria miniovina]